MSHIKSIQIQQDNMWSNNFITNNDSRFNDSDLCNQH